MTSEERLQAVLHSALAGSRVEAELALAPLRAYDTRHGGDLITTLAVYLALGGNATKAADRLYLHRSGLLYRLRRIEDLLGVRLDSFEYRVALELAVLATGSTDQATG